MVATLRSQFGPLPDQSMHEKTTVSDLIEEIYTFLKQADARELRHMFVELDEARANGGDADSIIQRIDNETHVVQISPTSMPVLVTKRPPTCWPSA